jgi:outer membrane protein
MQLSALTSAARQALALAMAAILTSASWGQAQQQAATQDQNQATPPHSVQGSQPQSFEIKDYSKSRPHFPNPIGPYMPRHVPPPNLANTPRIEQLLVNGKLMLSMNDAVALALENNLDIAIARYNLNIADTDVLRAKSGASILGVATGLVLGTPGGGTGTLGGTIGSGPGGTTPAQGGAGTGFGGIVNTTLGLGPQITTFDPVLTGTLQIDHANSRATSAFAGVPVVTQNTGTGNFAYQQGFSWGSTINVGFTNTRTTTNQPFNTLSPTLNSGFKFTLNQHLLQGFGFAPNNRFIRIAKNNREISDVAFRLQTITTVNQIENIYWDLVFAYENVRVQQETLAFAQKTLGDTRKQVEIGSLAPIEIVRAQSTVATDQQNLITAQNNLQLQQLLMKNALSRTLVDPRLAGAEVIPTSVVDLPAQEPVTPIEDLVNEAISHRAELAESRINLTNSEISVKAIRSLLLPSLDLFAYYGGSGVGGSQNPANLCSHQPPELQNAGFCTPDAFAAPSTSYGGTLNQLVNSSAPDKGVGLSLNIPLRNRASQSVQVRSELEYRQAQMRIQQLENQVRIEVRNAQFTVQGNRAAVDAAQAAVDFARQSLEAEQKKYALGASTTTLVLQNSTALASAQSNLVSAKANYAKSRVDLDRVTGLLLDRAGILITDAERGQVTHSPNVPFVGPRKEDNTGQQQNLTQPQSVTPQPDTQAPAPPPQSQPPQQ